MLFASDPWLAASPAAKDELAGAVLKGAVAGALVAGPFAVPLRAVAEAAAPPAEADAAIWVVDSVDGTRESASGSDADLKADSKLPAMTRSDLAHCKIGGHEAEMQG